MKALPLAVLVMTVISCSKNKNDNIEILPSPSANPVTESNVNKIMETLGTGPISENDIEIEISRSVKFDFKNGIRGTLSNFKQYVDNLNIRSIKVKLKRDDYISNNLKLECVDEKTSRVATASFSSLVAEIPKYDISKSTVLNPVVTCSVFEDNIKKAQKRFKLYKDIYVTGERSLEELGLIDNQKNEIGALVFKKESILTTNGANLFISADEIISDYSIIQTFKEGATANAGEKGKSGGIVRINSKISIGELEIKMRGQNAGENKTVDETDYTNPQVIKNIYEAQTHKICKPGASMPVEIRPLDIQGYKGGDSGQFYLKSEESLIDVDIEGLPGMGGNGGLSYLRSKAPRISGLLSFNDHNVQVKRQGWAYELMDSNPHSLTVATCGEYYRKCARIDTGAEWEPNWNHPKSWDKCKNGVHKTLLATNFHYTQVSLALGTDQLPTLTHGETGAPGRSCSERMEDNTYHCL